MNTCHHFPMKRRYLTGLAIGWLTLALVGAGGAPARADDFYAGKTISLYAGRPPGGAVDAEMRLVAQFLGNEIPGHPRVLPLNMPGAGGVVLGNYLYNVAPKDGLTLGVPGRTSFILSAVGGNPNVHYDLSQFNWVGSAASSNFMLWMRTGSGVTTLEQLRQSKKVLVIGGSGNGNSDTVVPELLLKYEKLPFKVIRGYPGTSDEVLAMQRGEIDGLFTERAGFPTDPVASKLALPVFQTLPLEANLPLTRDVSADPRAKALIDLYTVTMRVGLALVAPPGVPPERVKILRDAYLRVVTNKEYIAEATKRGFAVGKPNPGEEIRAYLQKSFANVTPATKAEFLTYTH
jgi:tripartite-type tricarboxylate transporter receptor subunit TctC